MQLRCVESLMTVSSHVILLSPMVKEFWKSVNNW